MSLSQADAQNSPAPDSVDFAFLPAIAYNSDFGLMGGGLTNWFIYNDGMRPFFAYVAVNGIISTKGLAALSIEWDKPHIFGSDIRLKNELYTFRFFEDTYFGLGNYEELASPPENKPEYYLFKTFAIGFESTARFPVVTTSSSQQLDATLNINYDYETPWGNGSDRLITEPTEQPLGYNGGHTMLLGTGLIWEGRNSEFRPTRGIYAETGVQVGNSIWGSSYDNLILEAKASHYLTFHLIRDITFANRLTFKHTSGETPYWKLAYAGDEDTIRGYQSRRFLDDNSAILNSELRTWLFNIPAIDGQIGGNLFFDIGRTFNNDTPFDVWTRDLKYSFGFAGTASLFTPEFIIRGDVGFSKEDIGIYITTGYMF